MYKVKILLDKEIKNSWEYQVNKSNVYFYSKGSIIGYSAKLGKEMYKTKINYTPNKIIYSEKAIILLDKKNRIEFFDHQLNSLDFNISKELSFSPSQSFNGNLIISHRAKSLLEGMFGIYSIKDDNLLYEKEGFFPYTVLDEILIGRAFSILYRYDIKDGAIIWNFDVSIFGKFYEWGESVGATYLGEQRAEQIEKILGVYQSKLYLQLNSGRIIALDIHTGKLLREWWKLEQNQKGLNRISLGSQVKFDKQKGEIFCLLPYYCWKIDLKTEVLSFHDYENTLRSEKMDFWPMHSSINGTHIIGLVNKELEEEEAPFRKKVDRYLIALNRTTFKIDWRYRIDPTIANLEIGVSAPVFSENRMFFWMNGFLHIFEKDALT